MNISTYCIVEKGVSHDPCAEIYCGKYAFSEPSVSGVAQFVGRNSDTIRAYLAYHSYSQFYMTPYGYTKVPIPDFNDLVSTKFCPMSY